MECKNKQGNINCGKCKCDLISIDFVTNKDISKVAKVAAKVVWMKEFEYQYNASTDIKSIKIDCNGNITIRRNSSKNIDVSIAIHLYCTLIRNWYSIYSSNKTQDSYKYVDDSLTSLLNLQSINKLRSRSILISKYLESITTCTGHCSTVVPGKEIGSCKIPLSDINKIVQFSSEGLADTLNTIFYTIKDIAVVNLTIDLNKTYVMCNGNVIVESNFVHTKSTVADMKAIYVYYLSAWCSANISKDSEVNKIKENINKVKKLKYVHEMYSLSNDLLELLPFN